MWFFKEEYVGEWQECARCEYDTGIVHIVICFRRYVVCAQREFVRCCVVSVARYFMACVVW